MSFSNLLNKIELYGRGITMPRALALFLLVTVSAYLYTLNCGYIWDDDRHVLMDSSLWGLAGLWKIWFSREMQQYYPLIYSSFWIEANLWGLSPAASHLINAAVHAMNAFLLYAVLKHLNIRGALFAGLIFALHPVHVESVAWISERKNVLSGFFYLLSLYAFLKNEDRPGKGLYALSLVLFVMALLCKTVACTLPAALLIIRWMRGRDIGTGYAVRLVPFFAIGLAFGLLTIWWEANLVGASGKMWEMGYVERVVLSGRVFWFYLYKLLAPFELVFIYPRWQVDPSVIWQWVFPAAAVLAAALLLVLSRKIGRGPAAAQAFFLVTLFPALGFIDVYPFQFSFVADHFQYMASAGPISLFAATAAWAAGRGAPSEKALSGAGVLMAVVLLAMLWALSFSQTFAYKDSDTIWKDTIAKNPQAWIAHTNLAVDSINEDHDFAIAHLEKAYRLNPSNESISHALGLALFKKSRELSAKGMEAKARDYNGRAIGLYEEALALEPNYVAAHINLGVSLGNAEDYDGAISHFQTALRLNPSKTFVREKIEITLALKAMTHPLELTMRSAR
ncbi:MAG: tetratricopeptide repeat protein [Deltaproteobacteria bacterium]|nr:tetratricopeptide repeat protein [Deltaproteobacteria bacterium]